MLEIINLSSGYGKQKVLKGVGFTVPDGKLCGILGPNGSGKSTLIRTFFGIANSSSGQILLDGIDLLKLKPDEVSRKVAVQRIFKQPGLILTVREIIALGMEKPEKTTIDETISIFRLEEIQNKPVSQVSDGQYQRATLAQAAIKKPRLYLLDEPTSHLDLAFKHRMLYDIKTRLKDGSIALAIIHEIELARKYCDMVVMLGCGQVVQVGSPSLLDDQVLVSKLFMLDFSDNLS